MINEFILLQDKFRIKTDFHERERQKDKEKAKKKAEKKKKKKKVGSHAATVLEDVIEEAGSREEQSQGSRANLGGLDLPNNLINLSDGEEDINELRQPRSS